MCDRAGRAAPGGILWGRRLGAEPVPTDDRGFPPSPDGAGSHRRTPAPRPAERGAGWVAAGERLSRGGAPSYRRSRLSFGRAVWAASPDGAGSHRRSAFARSAPARLGGGGRAVVAGRSPLLQTTSIRSDLDVRSVVAGRSPLLQTIAAFLRPGGVGASPDGAGSHRRFRPLARVSAAPVGWRRAGGCRGAEPPPTDDRCFPPPSRGGALPAMRLALGWDAPGYAYHMPWGSSRFGGGEVVGEG